MRALTAICITVSLIGAGGQAMAIEQPVYRVIDNESDLEIRQYEPYIVAETWVEGEFGKAGNEGFMRLFRYITGSNQGRAKISMTAPVAQQSAGQKIEMTAPVALTGEGRGHWVSFMMPSQFTLATLPRPADERVRLREVPGSVMAVVRYSGFWSEKRYQKEEARLRSFIAERRLVPAGEPQFARYDPPYMPPFMRRNEIMIPLVGEPAVPTRATLSGATGTVAPAH
jgi:hypothetical protein